MINAMPITGKARVLDIGCGAGTVSLAAAACNSSASVTAIDSHSRAVQCTRRGAQLNELGNVTAIRTDQGEIPDAGEYDLVLANPPYYADFRVAELFLEIACRAMQPDGELFVVAKNAAWYEENVQRWFGEYSITPSKRYIIVHGTHPHCGALR